MKKILSVILVLAMVLALGTTAFAANVVPAEIEEGKTAPFYVEIVKGDKDTVSVVDKNGFLTIGNIVVDPAYVAFEVTAPAGTAEKLANIAVIVTHEDKTTDVQTFQVTVAKPATPAPAPAEGVLDGDYTLATVVGNKAVVDMGAVNGISAGLYNSLKAKNYETITFVGDDYAWTITRGDYTKMNVTASIYFGVDVAANLYKADGKVDLAAENAVLKALGTTQADVFYVKVADNCNIANVASKPALEVVVDDAWINFSNKFSVNAFKFDGETATKVASGLAVKPTTGVLTLNLTTAGTYVFVADNYTVNPAPAPSEKPNASTGANSAAAVVALAVMAVAAVASKKIVK